MQKSFVSFVVAAGMVLTAGAYGQQPPGDQSLPKELVQYVRDARKAGLNQVQIQQNAVNAGWPAETVRSALESALQVPEATKEKNTPTEEVSGGSTPPQAVVAPGVKANEPAPPPQLAPPPAGAAQESQERIDTVLL